MVLYDSILYPSLTHSYTHPDRLAVAGKLMGLDVALPDAARVLELGCGNGANVIAMAEMLPESSFLGIDLSRRQIEDGCKITAALGVKNVELRAADILALADDVGEFDYIIAHGLYSWVPEPVRQKALRIMRRSLAANGIAYVSYNAFPGWHQLAPLREMMLYHVRDIADPVEQARAARDFIAFLSESQAEDGPFAMFLRQYHSSFQGRGPVPEPQLISTLLHDELSEVNQPFYFHEFIEQAQAAGLEFLAEADLEGSTPLGIRGETVEKLRMLAQGRIETQQYLDFVRYRGFRRTLLCRSEAPVARTLRADLEALQGFFIGSPARPESMESSSRYVTPDGLAFTAEHPIVAAAFTYLGSIYPNVAPFDEVLEKSALALTGKKDISSDDANALAATLLRYNLRSRSLVELYLAPRPIAGSPGGRPRVSGYARYMARSGEEKVPNLRHEQVELSSEARLLLPLLDGETRQATLQAALKELGAGETSREQLTEELEWLAQAAMLLA